MVRVRFWVFELQQWQAFPWAWEASIQHGADFYLF